MAGPGSICADGNCINVQEGTSSLQACRLPGASGAWHDIECAADSAYRALSDGAQALLVGGTTFLAPAVELERAVLAKYGRAAVLAAETYLRHLVSKIRNAGDWATLNRLAEPILGPASYSAGLLAGLVESLVGDAWNLLGLAKMIVLAGLHERLQHPVLAMVVDPMTLALMILSRSMPSLAVEASKADDQLRRILNEVAKIAERPVDFIETVGRNIWKGSVEDWNKLQSYGKNRAVANDFESGRIVGRALYQVVMAILVVLSVAGVVVKLAAKVPAMLRLARIVRGGGALADLEEVGAVGRAAADLPEAAGRARTETLAGAATEQINVSKESSIASQIEHRYAGKLGSKRVELDGVKTERIEYTKRPRSEYVQLRKEFDGRERQQFLRGLAGDPEKQPALKEAGLEEADISRMADGRVPAGWQVHHKIPLDDGGTNDMSNLVLIKNVPSHQVLTNAQSALVGDLSEGASRTVDFPIPEGFVYPPSSGMVRTLP